MTRHFTECGSKEQPLELLATFCMICIKILSSEMREKFQKFGTVGMVQRIMVATVLLYDHLSPAGVFVRDSPISVRSVMEILLMEAGLQPKKSMSTKSKTSLRPPADSVRTRPDSSSRLSYQELPIQARNLITFLKYSNKHLKDPSTPKQVVTMFKNVV